MNDDISLHKHSERNIEQIQWNGNGTDIFKICAINFALKVITIGLYTFKAKTNLRRYMIGHFSLHGSHFEYTGTAMELFVGFVKALPIWVVLFVVINYLDSSSANPNSWTILLYYLAFFLFIVFLGYAALYASYRYRVSRTTWRGIRGRLAGSAFSFGFACTLVTLVRVMSLGLFSHWADHTIYKLTVSDLYFGNQPVTYSGEARGLFSTHILTALLAIPTLGISRVWYRAKLQKYTTNNTMIGTLKLKHTATGADLFFLYFKCFMVMIPFGIFYPYTLNMRMKYISDHISVNGKISEEDILQAQGDKTRDGEGLETVLDVDSGIFG